MAEMYEKIDNHAEIAKERMIKRFKGKPNIDKVITAEVDRWQIIEDVLYKMLQERAISTGNGIALDKIGEFFADQGLRNDRTDEEYRAFLTVLPAKLRQAGQHEVLISALKNLTDAIRIETEYFYPRSLALYAVVEDVESIENLDNINREMQSIVADGINLNIGLKENTGMFQFSNLDSGEVPAGTGFASLDDGSDGGKFIKGLM